MDLIQNIVQVFLRSCNTTAVEDVDSGALAEFKGIQKRLDRGDRLTLTLRWVDWPASIQRIGENDAEVW